MDINDREYRIVIPEYDNSGKKIRPDEIETFVKKMAEHFGGATAIKDVYGCWEDENKNLVCEKNMIVFSDDDSEQYSNWEERKRQSERFIQNLAKELGERFGQASVYTSEEKVEVNFVKGRYKPSLPSSMAFKTIF